MKHLLWLYPEQTPGYLLVWLNFSSGKSCNIRINLDIHPLPGQPIPQEGVKQSCFEMSVSPTNAWLEQVMKFKLIYIWKEN